MDLNRYTLSVRTYRGDLLSYKTFTRRGAMIAAKHKALKEYGDVRITTDDRGVLKPEDYEKVYEYKNIYTRRLFSGEKMK